MSIKRHIRGAVRSVMRMPMAQRRVGESGGAAVDIVGQIRGIYGTALQLLLLARIDDVALVGGKVATWADRSGNARDATQGTDAARPTYSATGLNSRPGLTLDGGDIISTGAFDLTAYNALAVHIIFQDSIAGNAIVMERSADGATTNGGFYIVVNNGGVGELKFLATGNVGASSAETTVGVSMATPAIVTGTTDFAPATNESILRHAKADVTATRGSNSNNSSVLATANFGNHAIHIGARTGGVAPVTGVVAAVAVAAWSTGVNLAQVQAAESLLAAEWGL